MGRQYCIIGTAGHIDHGKSSLVRALTGTDPDRLPEEKARGMTIELGFAHLSLPDAQGQPDALRIGIVDVPGHERFVRMMVAGATGVDLGMLVVAADDGVMPQTREHVEILDLLGVSTGLVAMSKVDLVQAERIEEVRRQIAALAAGTVIAGWRIVPVSSKTGQGLDEVRRTVAELAEKLPPRGTGSIFRLAIDRVFAIRGRGTVVTGSVLSGRVELGTVLDVQPAGLTCKVREVQSYGAAVEKAGAGQRAALNLTGVDREALDRGMQLATPGYLTPSRYVDARLRLLARLDKPLQTHRRVRVSMGTSEAIAMLVVVGAARIDPGQEAIVQLRFARPVVAAFGERYIVRSETAEATLGGGRVVRPVSRRVRPSHPDELEAILRCESADPFVRFDEAIRRAGFEPMEDVRLACEIGVEPPEIGQLRDRLQQEQAFVSLPGGRQVHRGVVEAIRDRALAHLQRHHAISPTQPGVLRDRFVGWIEARSAPGCGKVILSQLEAAGSVVARGPYVAHRAFRPAMSPEDAALLDKLVAEIEAAGFDPPAWTALKTTAALSKQRSKMLEDVAKCDGRLLLFAPQCYISAAAIEQLKQTVRTLGAGRAFKLAEVRDALKLSRRVVQPLLEYLDRVQFTKRVGDERVLQEGAR